MLRLHRVCDGTPEARVEGRTGGVEPRRVDRQGLLVQRGREEIIGIFSPARFDLTPVLEALRAGKPLDGLLPEGSVTATVPLKKR